eukprot:TRINITY_DN10344_c0_g1_i2.p1 TRINITY_DN10344_c0_g1~~TRINITY_DN10344_c0_g1_i2.p1  ORF type:complete len:307 (+),score=90.05 TRINITY_DN10344_c0_g1_i2:58-978(+)
MESAAIGHPQPPPTARTAVVNLASPSVDLSGLRVGPEVCKALCETLDVNQTVVDVDLSGNEIGDAGAAHVGVMLSRNRVMRFLNLSRNGLSDEGVIQVARGLRMNSTLRVLSVSANPFGDKGGSALAGMLAHNSGLRELVLLDCGLTHRGAVRLAAGMAENRTLLYLSLPFTIGYRLSDEIQRLLRRNWREHNQVPERLLEVRRLAEAEAERARRSERSWVRTGQRMKADAEDGPAHVELTSAARCWGDRVTGTTMLYLHLLERKREAAKAKAADAVLHTPRLPQAPRRPPPTLKRPAPPRTLGWK